MTTRETRESSLPVIGPALAYRMVDMLHLSGDDILVIPVANRGELVKPIFTETHRPMFAVPRMTRLLERDEDQCSRLMKELPQYDKERSPIIVLNGDFLQQTLVDATVIALGPPVGEERDIYHVYHAWKMLVPGGRLVPLCSETAFQGLTGLSQAFLAFLDVTRAAYTSVSPDSFSDRTTKAKLVYLEKHS